MNGSANGASNGVERGLSTGTAANTAQINGDTTSLLPQIQEALAIVHGPYSTNDSRRKASDFLEKIKNDREAPYHGFTLALDASQEPVVRHYALSLLEHAIKHKWAQYSKAEEGAIRRWVIQLSQEISEEDPVFLRNKIAQLWVEIAKRSWAEDWMDMDELLYLLWSYVPEGSTSEITVHKEFVLFVLETLSDEVFNGEDTIAILREGVLSKACVEVFTSASTLAEAFPDRQIGNAVRYRDEGWLARLSDTLDLYVRSDDLVTQARAKIVIVKILDVFRSAMPWAIPKAIMSSNCVQSMVKSLARPIIPVQLACVEALHALYNRQHFSDEEFLALVCPMYTQQVVGLLQEMFQWSVVDPRDIDDEKYLFSKKFSEMISNLGSFLEPKISVLPTECDLPGLLGLFLAIVQSKSFVVSIPVLVTWSRLMRSDAIGGSPALNPFVAPLLEVCISRLVRYESLPEDTEDPSLMFLLEDIDTIPERHAFLGNYRRYSTQIIEYVVKQKQSEALYHILGEVDRSLQHLYDGHPPFSIETYHKSSVPFLKVDASFTVVEAALKGYMRWRAGHGGKPQQDEQARTAMENNLEAWCERLLELNFPDPAIRQRALQLAVAFSTSALDKRSGFALKVLEHILMTRPAERLEHPAYNEAVREMQNNMMYELQRLATKMPDQLLDVYPQIEGQVQEIISSGTLDPKRQTSYQTFLFTIVHRTSKIDPEFRLRKLFGFVKPVQDLWQAPELNQALSTFPDFCGLLGLDKIKDYLETRRVHEIEEWNLYQLDAEGQGIQKELEIRLKALPLRTTKSFLSCSTDKIERNTPEYEVSRELWRDALPLILPNLLQFVSHAHAFHNPANWTGLPPEMRSIVTRILTDRFWQAGISAGSKDDFFARVTGTKSTMEGLASSIRGSVRTVREACYAILWGMSKLDVDFYGFSELPGPLAHALFADAHCLSSHQLIGLLNVARLLIDDCPVELRDHFVPPILATCFAQMDTKCSSEWEKLAQMQVAPADPEHLTEEMKEESILRQLTHTAVMMIGGLLDPARQNPGHEPNNAKEASTYVPDKNSASKYPSMRKFCLSSPKILEPLLLFLSHAIRMRDGRCCGIVLRVFRSIIPEFTSTCTEPFAPSIREFISNDVLKACISSLNEPYFADLHKDLAQLIASIIASYSSSTNSPKTVLLSIPGIEERAISKCIDYITRPGLQPRQQRALVLDLLRDIKGVSISEQGRISKTASSARKERSKMQQEFMKEQPQASEEKRKASPSLEGVADMFEDAKR